MKNYFNVIKCGFIALIPFACSNAELQTASGRNLTLAEFRVWGNCEMCQETIEESLKSKGVASASWSVDTKILKVSYDSTAINLDDIQKKVAAAGYDTEKYRADESAYKNLHECCQYERRP
jgi:periplasmic mercuric ion binding protein